MIITKINNKVDLIKSEFKTIKQKQLNIILNKTILYNDILKYSDFKLNNLNNIDNLIQNIRSKLNSFNNSSLEDRYKNIKIYKVILIQLNINDKIYYYLKLKKCFKNLNIYFNIKNKIMNDNLNKQKNSFIKISSYLNLNQNIFSNYIWTDNSYNKLAYNIKCFKKLNLYYNQLLLVNSDLKEKIDIQKSKRKKSYSKMLEIQISLLDKNKFSEKLLTKLNNWKFKKINKIENLKMEIKKLSFENLKLNRNIINEYYNFDIKIVEI